MKEVNIGGKTFQDEKIMPERFKKGACAFRVNESDHDDTWCGVVPHTLKEAMEGVEIESPNDGHIAAFCMSKEDALMIASSINLATSTANVTKIVKEAIDRKTKELADKLDYDLDALEAEVKRLKAEGKSPKEVEEILKPRMDEFRKKPAADKESEW